MAPAITINSDPVAEPTPANIEVTETNTGGVQVTSSTPPETPAAERPEWLPEKFENPAAMAAAYAALEQKLGGAPKVDAPPVPTTPVDGDLLATAEAAGVDVAAIQTEYSETGELSQATLDALAAKGIPNETVNSYIAGQVAVAEKQNAAVAAAVGGPERLTSILEWAKTNLSTEDVNAYNSIVDSGDITALTMTMEGISARYSAANGQDATVRVGGELAPTETGPKPFASNAVMVAAMRDPRYQIDPDYRQEVADRVAVS